jgi:predicted O-methyltransferase YrrM
VRSERDRVDGWLARVDAEIFRVLMQTQSAKGLHGGAAEIGVHHGKSFICLCLALAQNEKAYCIDVFEDQNENLDGSGKGDRQKFEENLKAFRVPAEQVVIRQASSLNVIAEEIVGAVGPVRFFSIDGGHWQEIVENDLSLAEHALAPHGVIALDDFHRSDWPDVSVGYFRWRQQQSRSFAPIAIGFNKLYICDPEFAALYQAALGEDPFLSKLVVRPVGFEGKPVPVFRPPILPEASLTDHLAALLRISRPQWFIALKDALIPLKDLGRRHLRPLLGKRRPSF